MARIRNISKWLKHFITQTKAKEPKDIRWIRKNDLGGTCPNCGRIILFAQRYCHNCTQLLDWTKAVEMFADEETK